MIYDKKRNEQRLTGKKNILLNNRTMEIKNLKREIKRIRNKKNLSQRYTGKFTRKESLTHR